MRIYVERSDKGKRNRIYLFSKYHSGVTSRCKQIPGVSVCKEHGRFKCWSFPLDYSTCVALRAAFGSALDIGPELWAWAEKEKGRHENLAELLDGAEGVCPRVEQQAPKLAAAFASRPYQATGAEFLAQARYALCGDDPGLGKTLETFGAVIEAGYNAGVFLVFCPSSAVLATWLPEIRRWLPDDNAIPCVGERRDRIAALSTLHNRDTSRRTWFICNMEMCRVRFEAVCPGPTKAEKNKAEREERDLAEPCSGEFKGCHYVKRHKKRSAAQYPELFAEPWDAIILDESHKAIVTRTSLKGKQTQQRVGFGALPLAVDGLRIALSGTPWRGKPINFWGTLNWLRPDIYTGFWRWAEKFFDIDNNGFGKVIDETVKPEMEDEWQRELRSVMIRRTKQEVAPDLPPKIYAGTYLTDDEEHGIKGIWIPMSSKQERVYRKFEAEAAVRLASGQVMYGNGTLSEMNRLRQLATAGLEFIGTRVVKGREVPVYEPVLPSNKFEWLISVFLPERGIVGDVWGTSKVIVSSNYTKVLNLFRAELKHRGVESHILTGEVTPRERARQVAEFQGSGGPRIFLLNTNAGGTSLTLDAADDVVKIDRSWNPDDDTQLEDRAHRISRTDHQVTIYNLYSLGTIEEEIGRTADSRDDLQRVLLDGARGVRFARKLLGGKS